MLMMSLEHKGSSQSHPTSWGLKQKLSGTLFSLKNLIPAPLQESTEDDLGLRGSKYSAQCLAHRTSLINDHFFPLWAFQSLVRGQKQLFLQNQQTLSSSNLKINIPVCILQILLTEVVKYWVH